MRPTVWQPPVETTAGEDKIIKGIKRAKLFVFLRRHRHQLFSSEFQAELATLYKECPRGQPPVPPARLALALILQAYTGVSDDEVIEATLMDRRWQLALDCLDAETPPSSQGNVGRFSRTADRKNYGSAAAGAYHRDRGCERGFRCTAVAWSARQLAAVGCGASRGHLQFVGARSAQGAGRDCPPAGAGRGSSGARQAGAEWVTGSSLKAALDLEWDNPEARAQALTQVLAALENVEQWLDHHPELIPPGSPVPDCLEAARQVRAQNVTNNEAGEPMLIKGVAKDRRISIEDAEMRPGRKSRSVLVDGYKRHLLRDLDRGLIAAVGVTAANAPEASVAEPLKVDLDAQKITLKELHIDRAYLSSTLVSERTPELEIDCKAWPVQQRPYFSKTAFHLDWEQQVIRCPNGVEMTFELGGVVHFPVESCASCPLRTQCTRSARGRSVSINAEEQLPSRVARTPTDQ
jgi:hypothetical protein